MQDHPYPTPQPLGMFEVIQTVDLLLEFGTGSDADAAQDRMEHDGFHYEALIDAWVRDIVEKGSK